MRCKLVFDVKTRMCVRLKMSGCELELFTLSLSHCHLIVECRLYTHYTHSAHDTLSDKYISSILNTPVNIYYAFGICYVLITDTSL